MQNPIQQLVDELNANQCWEESLVLGRNDFIRGTGHVDTNLYYIESGCVRVFMHSENQEHTIRFGYQDNLLASLDSFMTGQASVLHLQCIRKSSLKRISKASLMAFIAQKPQAGQIWQQILELLVVQQFEREQDLLIASPQTRYERVLKRSPRLFQEVPHKYIASYLRMSPETLSRLKKS
jgi:CRP-like cAMP-binding protein